MLHSPSSRWRGLRGQKQFIAYMRYSAHALTVMWAALFISFAAQVGERIVFLVSSSGIVLAGILTLWVVETAPRVNSRIRAGRIPALVGAGAGLLLLSITSISVTAALDSGPAQYQIVVVAIVANIFLAWAVVPQLKGRWILVALLAGVNFYLCRWLDFGDDWAFLLATFGFFLMMLVSEWTVDVYKELDQAKVTEAALSANNERLRIAQQLHDSLGQSLAAMNLKVQVIDKLLSKREDAHPALAAEVHQLKNLLNETSTHMREVVHDYRKIDLQGEFRNAQHLLESSGILVRERGTLGDVGELTESAQQAAGWFLREVSTNILRHSHASTVDISWASGLIKIVNDGATGPTGSLGGLDTLQQRARKDDGRIIAQREGDCFITSLNFGDHA